MSKSAVHSSMMGLAAHEKAPRPPPTFSTGNYKINYLASFVLLFPPIATAAAIAYGVPLKSSTLIVALVFYFFNGFGITAGYHRLFAHRAYSATPLLQWIMAFAGAGCFQGSIKWWGRNHRIHHRYIDTDKDPYNATRGFMYTHMGWMIMQQDYDILGRIDIHDFHTSSVVMLQHKFYFPIAMMSGIILPTVICGLMGDWMGGYCYAALAKIVFIHHTTFFINSLAHTSLFGARQNYADTHTSHDSFVCAVLTLGEGYHNFHHEFANDYRNGVKWYHYDPTKWLIRFFEIIGLAKNLQRTPNVVIDRNRRGMKAKYHKQQLEKWVDSISAIDSRLEADLPCMTMDEVTKRCATGEKLVTLLGYVVDLNKKINIGSGYTHRDSAICWYDVHPGGKKILDVYVGKDASEAFTGGVYRHSIAAMNMLPHLRVARLVKA